MMVALSGSLSTFTNGAPAGRVRCEPHRATRAGRVRCELVEVVELVLRQVTPLQKNASFYERRVLEICLAVKMAFGTNAATFYGLWPAFER